MALAGVVIAAIVVALLFRAAGSGDYQATLISFVILVLGWTVTVMWYRQQRDKLRELETRQTGGLRHIHPHMPWPKECTYCGAVLHSWRAVRTHRDPLTSPCAAHEPPRPLLQVAPEPAPEAASGGAVDTMLDPGDGTRAIEER